MYFWLPLYLFDGLHYDQVSAGLISTAFDVGCAAGPPIVGYLADRYPHHGMNIITVCSLVGVGALAGIAVNFVPVFCLLILGVSNSGPDILLCGPISNGIGEKDGRKAGFGVTSIVNGVSGIGSVFEGPVLGLISNQIGLPMVPVTMAVASFLAAGTAFKANKILL